MDNLTGIYQRLSRYWMELMPKDFNPNKSEELFAIQLHSQEKLDAIMSFYKERMIKCKK